MKDVNDWTVTARIMDYELKALESGISVCNLLLSFNNGKKVDGVWQDSPNQIEGTIWGPFAEAIFPILNKGRECTISAEIEEQKWNTVDGRLMSKIKAKIRTIKLHGGNEWNLEKDTQPTSFAQDAEVLF